MEELAVDTSRTSDKTIKRALHARASRRMQAWSLTGRRVQNLIIEDPVGVPYPSPADAADALDAFWGPRFSAANGISDETAGTFLNFITPSSITAEPLSLSAFEAVLQVSPSSTPGPDGLCFPDGVARGIRLDPQPPRMLLGARVRRVTTGGVQ